MCYGYSLEALRRGASNEYPQHMSPCRNKKNIMWLPSFFWRYDYIVTESPMLTPDCSKIRLAHLVARERWIGLQLYVPVIHTIHAIKVRIFTGTV